MELPTGPAARAKARWPWIALASVFILPVVGAALGVPLGEWLAVLSGERQIPEFWLRGEKSHFSSKPKDPLGPLSPGSLAFIAKEAAPPPPAAAPAAAGSTAWRPAPLQRQPTEAGAAPPSPAQQRPDPRPPLFRPPRLRNVKGSGEVVSWFQGSETTRRAESRTEAFVQAQAPPPAAAPAAAGATAPQPAPPGKQQAEPPPPPPRRERRRIAGRASPGTAVGPAIPPGEQGPGPGGIELPPPDMTAPPPNPSQAPPASGGPNPCYIAQTPAGGVRPSPVVERYPVAGATYEQLAARLAQETSGGRHGPGRTTGEVKAQCRFKQEGHLCTPLCSVDVQTRRRLPLWDLAGPSELIDRWTLFAKRVAEHELSHEAIFVREGNELLRRLGALERTPCKEVRASVDLTGIAVRDEFRKKHREYDDAVRPIPRCRQEL